MDPQRFDRVVRALAEGHPRRRVLKGLLAGIAGLATIRPAGAQLLDIGEPCLSDTQCNSGICADGYCCSTLCINNCEACNVPGSEGTCTFLPFGHQPNVDCPDPGVCDGAGGCCFPNGTVSPAENCCSGFAPQNVCCDTACTGACETCTSATSWGTCTTIPGCGGCDPGEVDCGQGCVEGDCCDDTDCAGTGECGIGVCDNNVCFLEQRNDVCGACEICNENHLCEGLCNEDQCCCGETGTCSATCCEPDSECEDDEDCAEHEHCCGGVCQAHPCKKDCKHDHDCGKDTCCCKDDTCSWRCCDKPHPPKKHPRGGQDAGSQGGPIAVQLPATGTGDESGSSAATAAATAAAAALLLGSQLRKRPSDPDPTE
jgi:hypothetical protein